MAKKSSEEILKVFSDFAGDRVTEDAAIALMEDIADSVTPDVGEDWEKKYNDLDREWRDRYTKRFYDGNGDEIIDKKETVVEEKTDEEITVDDLFKEE